MMKLKRRQLVSITNFCLNNISIENLNTVIHGMRKKLDIIHSNIRHSAVRSGTHFESIF
jgi:hypothetical protein